jgi:hypothetical protein
MKPSGDFLRHTLTTAAALACILAAAPCLAQGRPPAPPTEQQLAEQAYAQQESGHYAEAVATYLKAYEMSKDGLTLLNIATIYDRKLHEPVLASEYYRRYLMSPDADPERVRKVTERLELLRQETERAAQPSATPPPPPVAPAPAPAPSPPPLETTTTPLPPAHPEEKSSGGGTLRALGIVVGSVGLAGVAGSMVLGEMAKNKNDQANAVCRGSACSSGAGVQLANDAGNFATVATATFIGGATLLASGVIMFALAPSGPKHTETGLVVAPSVGTTGGGLLLRGAF